MLTNPKYVFHVLDAGRAIQDMQLAAWNYGVSSRIFSGFEREKMTRDFTLPAEPRLTAVVGFGYPAKRLSGKKNRMPIGEVAFLNRYGQKLTL